MTTTNDNSNKKTKKHVIFGAGPLGLSIMDALVANGYTGITLANRSGMAGESLPAGVTIVQGDVTKPDDVARICADATVVFFCAQPAYTRWPEEFPPMIRAFLQGMARTQAKVIFGDNLYMYGSSNGQPIRETMPYAATTRKGKARAEVATILLDAHKAGTVKVAIGRASDFYGPRVIDSSVGEMLFGAALEGQTVNQMGDLSLPHTYTYIKDFGAALVTLSEHDEALGQVWHVPNAPAVSTQQFIDQVQAEVGKPIKVRTAGRTMMAFIGLFSPEVREVKEMLYEFEEPFVVDDSKFRTAFGASATPLKTGIDETVAWNRSLHK